MSDRRFCAIILTHGRPGRIPTLDLLNKLGYTGDIMFLIDNEDATGPEYHRLYGDRVVVFDKAAEAATTDTGDLSTDRCAAVFARNASFRIAAEHGYTHFLQLDDDYLEFLHRFEDGPKLSGIEPISLDAVFDVMLNFLDDTGVSAVAFAQGGDLLGGMNNPRWKRKVMRKAMNTWFCRSSDTWRFAGRLNDDVNAYVTLSHRGHVFLTTMYVAIKAEVTQKSSGGMSEVYQAGGTYQKSFFTVMMAPGIAQVGMMQSKYGRLHHHVVGNACYPKIIPESYRKSA